MKCTGLNAVSLNVWAFVKTLKAKYQSYITYP